MRLEDVLARIPGLFHAESVLALWHRRRGEATAAAEHAARAEEKYVSRAEIARRFLEEAQVGAPAYISPEQANGLVDRLDRRADVFGLGAIFARS